MLEENKDKIIQFARSPARISLAGGGTDFSELHERTSGESLSFCHKKFAYCQIAPRIDGKVRIFKSGESEPSSEFGSIQALSFDGQNDLVLSGVIAMSPNIGFDLTYGSDIAERSGLGGSSALLCAVIEAIGKLTNKNLDPHQRAICAFKAERLLLGVIGGWQDQYASSYGGFNHITYSNTRHEVANLNLPRKSILELEHRLLFCSIGEHNGVKAQKKHVEQISHQDSAQFVSQSKDLVREIKTCLMLGRLEKLGELITRTWEIKKEFNSLANSKAIDEIENHELMGHVDGFRLLGTGGDMFCFLLKNNKHSS